MDYMSVFPSTKNGNDCVFVVFYRFFKMAILAPCKKKITIKATGKVFFDYVWVHFGLPLTIISDTYSNFLNNFWYIMWSLMDTKLTKLTTF
jgi:hypothetical protein